MYSVKITFDNEVRRFQVEDTELLTFVKLEQTVRRIFNLSSNQNFSIFYNDDEDDLITFSTDQELLEAIRLMQSVGTTGTLKFVVVATPTSTDNFQTQQSDANQSTVVHTGVTCDDCGVCPIVGNRFKCSVRDDFDLCETCESKQEQPYPMLKIFDPQQAPVKFACVYSDGTFAKHGGRFGHGERGPHHHWFGGRGGGGRGGCGRGGGGHWGRRFGGLFGGPPPPAPMGGPCGFGPSGDEGQSPHSHHGFRGHGRHGHFGRHGHPNHPMHPFGGPHHPHHPFMHAEVRPGCPGMNPFGDDSTIHVDIDFKPEGCNAKECSEANPCAPPAAQTDPAEQQIIDMMLSESLQYELDASKNKTQPVTATAVPVAVPTSSSSTSATSSSTASRNAGDDLQQSLSMLEVLRLRDNSSSYLFGGEERKEQDNEPLPTVTLAPVSNSRPIHQAQATQVNAPAASQPTVLATVTPAPIVAPVTSAVSGANVAASQNWVHVEDASPPRPSVSQQFQPSANDAAYSKWRNELQVLLDMGFRDVDRLVPVIEAHCGSAKNPDAMNAGMQRVITAILNGNY